MASIAEDKRLEALETNVDRRQRGQYNRLNMPALPGRVCAVPVPDADDETLCEVSCRLGNI
jgi:hypothetical protein